MGTRIHTRGSGRRYEKSAADKFAEIADKLECERCGKPPVDGHDACINNLPGVAFACCRHGKGKGYIKFLDGTVIRGNFIVERV